MRKRSEVKAGGGEEMGRVLSNYRREREIDRQKDGI